MLAVLGVAEDAFDAERVHLFLQETAESWVMNSFPEPGAGGQRPVGLGALHHDRRGALREVRDRGRVLELCEILRVSKSAVDLRP